MRPLGARATFSLLAQRESSQRETAPRGGAFCPSVGKKSVRRGRAFRAGILPARKGEAIPGLARCAAFRTPPHRRRGAPRTAARIVRARSQSITRERSVCFGRADARLPLWGPYGAAGGLRIVRQDGPQGGGPVFRRHTEVPSENPAAHPRTRRAGCPEGAPSGWPLFCLLFSGHSEKSSSDAQRAFETALVPRPPQNPRPGAGSNTPRGRTSFEAWKTVFVPGAPWSRSHA